MIDINDSCRTKRGCNVDIDPLAHDSVPQRIYSGVFQIGDDFLTIPQLFDCTMDKELEKKRQMEEVLA